MEISLSVTDVANINENEIPNEFILVQNYPNPFNPSTKIEFTIPVSENVRLVIYDVLGNQVSEMINKTLNAGKYDYIWLGKNDDGIKVSAGIYFYRIEAGSFLKTKKMILLK